mmetsp:Transcript_13238/g.15166  ORF Transcript_13238/g.15166 Transcript_13238/m.15166 type:complete len:278 (-) Transcript_13238:179-1012(-)|eukprot:CAMPEP_0194150414 /NCGR_PEP_ID=MMETSP0152-20130528/43166_1 /TAXON_ID=1049557 /ORGANISM="Thalassiothrix antarctica, Strain L6-D1" /LENGTH=277 /DNA_ID=CAMNT_0038853361 /DNA_START=183 /DNA_END=1016 /DNA_ORIENTATION=+
MKVLKAFNNKFRNKQKNNKESNNSNQNDEEDMMMKYQMKNNNNGKNSTAIPMNNNNNYQNMDEDEEEETVVVFEERKNHPEGNTDRGKSSHLLSKRQQKQQHIQTLREVLSKREWRLRRKLNSIRWWMDDSMRVPCSQIRFGIDPVIGMVPVLGDVASYIVSVYFVYLASPYVSKAKITKMLFNCWLDATVGSIPLAGDLFDFGFRANDRNLAVFDDYMIKNTDKLRERVDNQFLCCLLLSFLIIVLGSIAVLIGVIILLVIYLKGRTEAGGDGSSE